MPKYPKSLLLILLLLLSAGASATHIVGGDFSLRYISGNRYELTLKMLRDCTDPENAGFNPSIEVGIYNKRTHSAEMFVSMLLSSNTSILKFSADNCLSVNIPEGCTQMGIYTKEIILEPDNFKEEEGYYFSWARCCRNHTIQNINDPGATGIVFYMEVPKASLKNSTPVFTKDPMTLLCINNPFSFNYEVVDEDGDSLVYSLTDPLKGWTTKDEPNPDGNISKEGPYEKISWSFGFSANKMIDGDPNLTINPRTGQLSVTPDRQGIYAVAILVEEFRNGRKIGEVRRELQFTVSTCPNNAAPSLSMGMGSNISIIASEKICFTINASDPKDSLYMKIGGTIFDSSETASPQGVIKERTGFKNIKSEFCWQTHCDSKSKTLIVDVLDNGCPLPRRAIANVKINVVPMPLVPSVDMLCMELFDNRELNVYWGDSSKTDKFFNYYLLFRGINGSGYTIIDTIRDRSLRSFHDFNVIDYRTINYEYFIIGVNLCGKYGPASDTLGTFEQLKVAPDPQFIKSVSVEKAIDPKDSLARFGVKIEWTQATEEDFAQYIIYKRASGDKPFEYLTNIPLIAGTSYIDHDVNVYNTSYCYKIVVKDTCGNYSLDSRTSCTIVLAGKSRDYEHDLSWNKYIFWKNDVQRYEIWRRDPATPYKMIGSYNKSTLKATDDKLNYNEGAYWYKIIAYTEGDSSFDARSQSNEIFLIQKPHLYVPTAFTPDGNGLNDVWGHVPVFVKDFHLEVYNRFGQRVFESFDKLTQWDGTLRNGVEDWGNAFIWVVTYSGWDNSYHYQTGTVTVVK